MNYYCVRVRGISDAELDALTEFCFDSGASGVEEALAFTQPSLEYEAQILKTQSHDIVIYFDTPPSAVVHRLQELYPKCEISLSQEVERDWLAEWKKGFQAFPLAGPFWVVPSWLPVPSEATKPLIIDPGMAFGTGTHATTQLCARFLVSSAKPGLSLIDVGTGTGILAMMGRMLGCEPVVGLDNDPEARRVARENIKLNKITGVDLPDRDLAHEKGAYDILVANIIDGVLLKLRSELLRVLKPGGLMILGGILLERESEFLEPFLYDSGLKLLHRSLLDDWVSYSFQKL